MLNVLSHVVPKILLLQVTNFKFSASFALNHRDLHNENGLRSLLAPTGKYRTACFAIGLKQFLLNVDFACQKSVVLGEQAGASDLLDVAVCVVM